MYLLIRRTKICEIVHSVSDFDGARSTKDGSN